MSDIGALVERLVSVGVSVSEASTVIAEAFAAGVESAAFRSSGAVRQARYRERKRNESVTKRNGVTLDQDRNESVTNRNESVTSLRSENNDIYLTTTSIEVSKKEGRKKERTQRKRNAPLRDDWIPSLHSHQLAEQHGQNVQVVEQIFRDYLKSSGKLYADYDAAFNNFIRNQQRFNGGTKNGAAQVQPGRSLTDSIRRELAELERTQSSDLEVSTGAILRISD